jgi:LPS export ABC transporter protein LptC
MNAGLLNSKFSSLLLVAAVWLGSVTSCTEEREHTAPAIHDRDSVAMMTSYGVNTLISDSGVIKYRIVAERWEINDKRDPSRWIFDKGVLLTQFDQTLHVQSYIQCDTAYYFDNLHMWEMRGRVTILTKQGLRFSSEELYWDEDKHEIWSNKYSHLVTPDREMQGTRFRSDEQMTHYEVYNGKGSFSRGDIDKNPMDTMTTQQADSARNSGRQPARPAPKSNTTIPMIGRNL